MAQMKMPDALEIADATQPGMTPSEISREVTPLPDPAPGIPNYPASDFNMQSIIASVPTRYVPTLQEVQLSQAFKPLPKIDENSSDAELREYGIRSLQQQEAQTALAYLNYQATKDQSVRTEIMDAARRGIISLGASPEEQAAMIQTVAAEQYQKVIEKVGYLPKEVVHDPVFQQFASPEVYAYCKTVKDIYDETTGASTGPIDTLLRGWDYTSATRDAYIKFGRGEIDQAEYESIMADAYYDYGFADQQTSDTLAQTAAGFLLPLTDPEILAGVGATVAAGAGMGALTGAAAGPGGAAAGAIAGGGRALYLALAGAYAWDTYETSLGRMMYRAMSEGSGQLTMDEAYKATASYARINAVLAFAAGIMSFGAAGRGLSRLATIRSDLAATALKAANKAKAAGANGAQMGAAALSAQLRLQTRARLAYMLGESAGVYGVSVGSMAGMAALEEDAVNKATGNNNSVWDAFTNAAAEAATTMLYFSGITMLPRTAVTAIQFTHMGSIIKKATAQAATDAAGQGMSPTDVGAAAGVLNRLTRSNKLYFNVDDIKEWADASGIDLSELGGDFARIDELKKNGVTTIVIEQADWKKNYADTDVGKQLYRYYTTAPGGFTLKEIREMGLTLEAVETFKRRNQETAAAADAVDADLQNVRTSLHKRMRDSEAFEDAGALNNTLNVLTAFYRAAAEATGLTPTEIDGVLNPTFGKSTLVLKPGAHNPERLGGFDATNMKFIFDRRADSATVMHEVSHFFLESMYRLDDYMQQKGMQNTELRNRLADFESWAGIAPGEFLKLPPEQRAAIQERFATAFMTGLTREKFDRKVQPMTTAMQAFVINALSSERRAEFKAAVEAYRKANPDATMREARQEAAATILEQEHRQLYGDNDMPAISPEMKRFLGALYTAEQQTFDTEARFGLDNFVQTLDEMAQSPDATPEMRALIPEMKKDIATLKEDIQAENTRQNLFISSLLVKSGRQIQKELKQMRSNGDAGTAARMNLMKNVLELRESKAFRAQMKNRLDRVRQSKVNQAWYKIMGDKNQPRVGLDRAYAKAHLKAETFDKLERKGVLVDKGGQEPVVSQIDMYWKGHDGAGARYEALCEALANRVNPRRQAFNQALKALINDTRDGPLFRYMEQTKDLTLGAEARAKIIRRAITVLSKGLNGRRRVVSQSELNRLAKEAMGRMKVRDMDARTVLSEAQKYNRRAIDALKRNDIEAAIDNLTMQEMITLRAAHVAKEGYRIRRRVEKLAKLCARSDKELSKNYNATLMMVPRAILARIGLYNMGKVRVSMDRLREYGKADPAIQQAVDRIDEFLEPGRFDMNWQDLSYNDLELALNIADMGRVDAKKAHRVSYGKDGVYDEAKAGAELLDAIKKKPASKISTVNKKGFGGQQVERNMSFRRWAGAEFIKSWIIRPLARFEAMGQTFVDHVYTPVRKAYDRYTEERAVYYQKVEAILNNFEFKEGIIEVPGLMIKDNHGNLVPLAFGATGIYRGCGQMELLGMLLHCGNQSNFQKLLRGYGWTAEQFDAAITKLIQDGWITKNMMDTVQAIWDANKGTAAKAQQAYYSMHGYYFKELDPRAIETPWGTYEGGYVPALTNRDLAEYNPRVSSGFEGDLDLDTGMPDTTNRNRVNVSGQEGNFQNRNEAYAQPLVFDPIKILNQNERIIRYAYMMPVARAIERTWQANHGEMIEAMRRVDPNFWQGFMLPWLKEAAEGVHLKQGGGIIRMYNSFISRTGAAIMCFNLSNTLQQVTGYSVALAKINPRALARGFALTFSKEARENMLQKSQYMRNRLRDAQVAPRGAMENIILDPSRRSSAGQKAGAVYKKAQRFSARNAYIFQKTFQNEIDTTVWIGSYEEGLKNGLTEEQAIAKADRDVIETQGSYDSIDMTGVEKAGPLVRSLTMFGSYFYSIASLVYGEWVKAGNAPNPAMLRRFYILGCAFFVPNIVATMITKAMGRQSMFYSDDDKAEDPEDILAFRHAAWFDTIFGSQVSGAAGMVPIFGQFAMSAFNQWKGDTYYTDTRFNSPVFTVASAAATSIKNALDDDREITYSDVRNFVQGLSVVTGMAPLAPLGRSASYLYGVHQSQQIDPEDMTDYIFGIITGRASPKSKE